MQVDEGEADRNAIGHFKPYLTHRLDKKSEKMVMRDTNYEIKQIQTAWSKHTNTEALDFDGSRLKSIGHTTALNPYLNIQVDKELIKDHNDIWRPEIVAFIRDLIVISTTPIGGEQDR